MAVKSSRAVILVTGLNSGDFTTGPALLCPLIIPGMEMGYLESPGNYNCVLLTVDRVSSNTKQNYVTRCNPIFSDLIKHKMMYLPFESSQ